jgi:hypothetical protein
MADVSGKYELGRLQDFIVLAKEGTEVQLSVDLRKQIVYHKVESGETGGGKGEVDMYLLIGDYSFKIRGGIEKVSKIYVSGTVGEPVNATRKNINIVNDRLKMDYMRLREANIIFEEVYF